MTLSDLIVSYLEQFGVEYFFGVPGSPLGPLYDALARSERRGGTRAILTRHETGGAFMADGYARETGKIGVCCATTGPGATNLITGVSSAYADHIPLLVITAQTMLPTFSLGAFQESSADVTDIVGMFEHCTRF
jgi:acetolactate synthase-1/2/3 large subunit